MDFFIKFIRPFTTQQWKGLFFLQKGGLDMPQENEAKETNTRTRIKLSQNAKGLIQWEISAEYDTPEKSTEMLGKTIDLVKSLIAEKGLKAVEDAA